MVVAEAYQDTVPAADKALLAAATGLPQATAVR